MQGIDFTELQHDFPVEYYCPCTKERVMRALETFGVEDLQDMIDKKEVADVTCQMCGRPYKVSVEEIKELKDRLYKDTLH
jgi:molecular chaperone Hsp33